VKSHKVDWKLAAGFGALLFLIVVIGFIGISQIQALSRAVDDLGKTYLPMQRAILEMKINSGLYAMRIRNYIFWRGSKYLEAASAGCDLSMISNAARAFDRHLAIYSSHIQSKRQKLWVEKISASQQELRAVGNKIINLVDQLDKAGSDFKRRKALESAINKSVMVFEGKLYQVDDFLDKIVEKDNLEAVKKQLIAVDLARKRAISFLGVSLVIAFLVGGGTAGLVYGDRRRQRARREQLVQRMIRLEEEERRNLSAQIHDQMGQDLSALMIYIDLINKNLPAQKEEIKKNIIESKKILSSLIEKSHNISEFLRPAALEEIGLIDTIDALVLQYRRMTDINFVYEKPKAGVKLSGDYSLVLYRVVQEGLTNIIKHARAKDVRIILEVKNKVVRLAIQDNGVGFNYRDFLRQPRRRESDRIKLGLLGLKERVELLGGWMDIKTAPGGGTKLTVKLPIIKT